MKYANPYNYLAALNAADCYSYSSLESDNESFAAGLKNEPFNAQDFDIVFLVGDNISPEDIVIKKDAFEKLSDLAKEVIRMVIDTASNGNGDLASKNGFISPWRIKLYLRRKKKWNERQINKVMDEIVEWAAGL